jgi:taurine dioxygenase
MTRTTVAWTPITERFGARVDLDLNKDLSDAVLADLASLFDERGILVFRNQDIDIATQRRVVSSVGKPFDHEVNYVSTKHNHLGDPLAEPADPDPRTVMFHSDLVFDQRMPVHGISLYAEDVSGNSTPGFQGTRFISARNAYLDLGQRARAELDGRTAIYLHALQLSVEEQIHLREFPFDEIEGKVTWWGEHPVLYPGPRSGEPVLLHVPWFAHSIKGLQREETAKWFERFEELLYQEDQIYTHRWEQGDLVFWDNIAIQHCKERVEAAPGPMPTRVLRRSAFGPEEPNLY